MSWRDKQITWQATGDKAIPWVTEVDGAKGALRLNDRPGPRTYTLLVDGAETEQVVEWPKTWKLDRSTDPERAKLIAEMIENLERNQANAEEFEREKFERSLKVKPSKLVK